MLEVSRAPPKRGPEAVSSPARPAFDGHETKMDQPSRKPETADSNPFADLGEPLSLRRPSRPGALSLLRRVIAGLLLVVGALITAFGALMYGESKVGALELPSFAGKLMFWAGIGVCLLAFALYDKRGPFRFLRAKKPQ